MTTTEVAVLILSVVSMMQLLLTALFHQSLAQRVARLEATLDQHGIYHE